MMTYRFISLLVLCTSMLVLSEEARAQYNLRTQPATPTAGQPFSVVFDEDECEDFILQAPGQPPSFTLNGTEAVLAVDRIENPACDSAAVTVTIPVPALPAGAYTLRLVARDFVAPEITGTLQIVPLLVAQGVAAQPFTIPVLGSWGLVLLAGVSALLACVALRRA